MTRAGPIIRIASQWLVGILLSLALLGLFLAVNAFQLTSAGAGQRLLRRAVAVTTEIDALLPGLQSSLRQAARSSQGETVRVPDFPIPVDLPREEALTLDSEGLRSRLLDEAARRLYQDGMSAWTAEDPPGEQDIDPFSGPGAVHRGLGFITEETHTRTLLAMALLGTLSAMLVLLLIFSTTSYTRLIALGAATAAAALPSLAGAVALRFAFRSAQEEADPFVDGLLELGIQAMRVPIRNYLALTMLGFALLGLAVLLLWLSGRRPPTPDAIPTADPAPPPSGPAERHPSPGAPATAASPPPPGALGLPRWASGPGR